MYIILNCQRVALHGCHLAKSRLPVTLSPLKRIVDTKLNILSDITKSVVLNMNIQSKQFVTVAGDI